MAPQLSEEWLEYEKNALGGQRSVLAGTAEEIIAQFDAILQAMAAQIPPRTDAVITRDETADGVPVRIYTPKNATEKLPIGLYMHGGGFILGSLDSEDFVCRTISENVSCILVSVNYRHGPKYKQPAMVADCVTAFNWTWKHMGDLGGDSSKFFTIGSSAGGNLALAVAHNAAGNQETRGHLKGIVAIVPLTVHFDHVPDEYKAIYKSYEECGLESPMIHVGSMKTFLDAVNADGTDPNQFPALSKELVHFPPTYLVTCGADPLHDDGVIINDLLDKAGYGCLPDFQKMADLGIRVKTKRDEYPGLPHVFWTNPGLKSGETYFANLFGGTKWVLES